MKIVVYPREVWLEKYQNTTYSSVFNELPHRYSHISFDIAVVGMTEDDVPIGFITAKQNSPSCMMLCFGGTFPDFRGKGFGNDALQTTCKYLKDAGAEIIIFYTKQKNIPMQRLGLANGFFPAGFTMDTEGIFIEYQLNTEDL